MKLKSSQELADGRVMFMWSANNRGRGKDDNITLAIVAKGTCRAEKPSKQQGIIACCQTGGWRGDINLSSRVKSSLGI